MYRLQLPYLTVQHYGGYGDNYSANTYGGGAGGGFMNNYSGSQGGASQQTPGSASKNRASNTLRPVTIKQILEAVQPYPEAEFKIDDAELSHITFVAQIRNISEQTTNITYRMDDGTGVIEVKQWVDADDEDSASSKLTTNQYVRIVGALKPFNNKRHVGAHKIYAITDFNEVQYHLLEAAAIHLHFTRGPPEQFATGGGGGVVSHGQSKNVKTEDTAMGGMSGGSSFPPNASNISKRVYDAIRACPTNPDGIHANIISQKSGLGMPQVFKGVEELLELGLAYTTTDDNHFALMDF
ncbi:replication factor A2 [Morchella snyderi]|nr:replication factor A2 [Morchella snyderi]